MTEASSLTESGREDTTELAREQYERAYKLAKSKKPEEAIPLFMEIVRWDRGPVAKKVRREAHMNALWCLSQAQNWTGLDEIARLAVHRYPETGWSHRYLGEAQYRLGRMKKAISNLQTAIEVDPETAHEARAVLEVVLGRNQRRKAKVKSWPSRTLSFTKPRKVIENYLMQDLPGEPFISPDSVFMTLGSCFAENLARRLRSAGYTVNSEEIGEEVNSTYANRYLLEWIEHGPRDKVTRNMEQFYGAPLRERLKRYVEESDVFVLTLGLAPCFFEHGTGQFVFYPPQSEAGRTLLHAKQNFMRTTTVAENIRNLEMVLDSLRRMAKRPPTIVLTVSPVPLSGTSEMHSAVIADCVSKSTLRVACHEVMTLQNAPDLIYWPSFEIVRWMGNHLGPHQPNVYGDDDGNTRHVSNWVVKLIMDLFIERYSIKEAGADAGAQSIGDRSVPA